MPQTFVVRGEKRNYILAASTYEIALNWVTKINSALEQLEAKIVSPTQNMKSSQNTPILFVAFIRSDHATKVFNVI